MDYTRSMITKTLTQYRNSSIKFARRENECARCGKFELECGGTCRRCELFLRPDWDGLVDKNTERGPYVPLESELIGDQLNKDSIELEGEDNARLS
jgi:hypothetical protein